mgnify:FL=1
MASYFIKGKNTIYVKGGLVEDVFFVAVSNCALSPILRVIDFGYFIKKLLAKYYNRPSTYCVM